MKISEKTFFITGVAGFIGSNLLTRLLDMGCKVVGLDNFDDYYDPDIKRNNIARHTTNPSFVLYHGSILDANLLNTIFTNEPLIDVVIHLAAKAGVRASIQNPSEYMNVNVMGTVNILKSMRDNGKDKLIFSSSSSVYGNQAKVPFEENSCTNNQTSPYAASKKAAEVIIKSYAHSYGINSIILRFFTVYGPNGRPDMAPYKFVKSINENSPITQFGGKKVYRDFTYIDDVVNGIVSALAHSSEIKFDIFNLGCGDPIKISKFIKTIENLLNKKALIHHADLPQGDVDKTFASIEKAKNVLNWQPMVNVEQGLEKYINWYLATNTTD